MCACVVCVLEVIIVCVCIFISPVRSDFLCVSSAQANVFIKCLYFTSSSKSAGISLHFETAVCVWQRLVMKSVSSSSFLTSDLVLTSRPPHVESQEKHFQCVNGARAGFTPVIGWKRLSRLFLRPPLDFFIFILSRCFLLPSWCHKLFSCVLFWRQIRFLFFLCDDESAVCTVNSPSGTNKETLNLEIEPTITLNPDHHWIRSAALSAAARCRRSLESVIVRSSLMSSCSSA